MLLPVNLGSVAALGSQPQSLLDGERSRHSDEITWLRQMCEIPVIKCQRWALFLTQSKGESLSFRGSPGGQQLSLSPNLSRFIHERMIPQLISEVIQPRAEGRACLTHWPSREEPSCFQTSPRRLALVHLDWVLEFETGRAHGNLEIHKIQQQALGVASERGSEQKESSVCVFSPLDWRRDHTEHRPGLVSNVAANRSALLSNKREEETFASFSFPL